MSQKHIVAGLTLRNAAEHPVLLSYKTAAECLLPKALTLHLRALMVKKSTMKVACASARKAGLLKKDAANPSIANLIYSERYYGLLTKGSTALTVRK